MCLVASVALLQFPNLSVFPAPLAKMSRLRRLPRNFAVDLFSFTGRIGTMFRLSLERGFRDGEFGPAGLSLGPPKAIQVPASKGR